MTGLTELHGLLSIGERAVDEAVGWLATAGDDWAKTQFKESGEEVTDADTEVEARMTRVLATLAPGIPVIGEESTPEHVPLPSRCWLLDPIDGTMNFTRGSPMHAVSLAYAEGGVPLLGMIHAPALGRRWTTDPALRGSAAAGAGGAAGVSELRRAVVGISGTGSGGRHTRRFLDRVQDEAYRLRMQGSMALDLVGVCEGWLDACVCIGPKPWDIAAGVTLCRERGRTVLGTEGRGFSFDSPVLVAGAPGPARALVGRWEGH